LRAIRQAGYVPDQGIAHIAPAVARTVPPYVLQADRLEGRRIQTRDVCYAPWPFGHGKLFCGSSVRHLNLIDLANAFEQATKARRMPPGVRPLVAGCGPGAPAATAG